MKIKNITKIITTILLVTMLLTSFATISQATSQSGASAGTINPDDFKPGDLTASDTATAFRSAGVIVNAIINVGLVISIVMFMVLGMKYMMGSIEERAEYKKTLMPMIIGTLMLFVSGKIVSIIWGIMSQVNV
ncbi:MAG: hypothetical protein HFJ41_00995 [Clostridia bacterium]|nr:hypothetical protein [Clostridia bacterium]